MKKGSHLTDEQRKKASEAKLEFYQTEKGKEAIRKSIKSRKGMMAWNIGLTKETDERVRKISESQLGEKNHMFGKKGKENQLFGIKKTEEQRKINSDSHKGQIPWNKGLKGVQVSWIKGKTFEEIYGDKAEEIKKKISVNKTGKKLSEEARINIGIAHRGIPQSEETRKKRSNSMKGIKRSEETIEKMRVAKQNISDETRKRMSESQIGLNALEKHPNWQGGKSFEPYDISFNIKFKNAIRNRDNQICMLCGIHREKLNNALNVHHIDYDKLNSIKENCISLCESCHSKTNFGRKKWAKHLQEILTEKYNYQYTPEGKIIIEIKE